MGKQIRTGFDSEVFVACVTELLRAAECAESLFEELSDVDETIWGRDGRVWLHQARLKVEAQFWHHDETIKRRLAGARVAGGEK